MARSGTERVSEQERQKLAAWEMEYGCVLELPAQLREAYEVVYGSGGDGGRGEATGGGGR